MVSLSLVSAKLRKKVHTGNNVGKFYRVIRQDLNNLQTRFKPFSDNIERPKTVQLPSLIQRLGPEHVESAPSIFRDIITTCSPVPLVISRDTRLSPH